MSGSSNGSAASGGGISFFALLTLLFIGLKLTKCIDWSWWWVLSPLWLSFAVAFVCMIFAAIVYAYYGRH